MEQQHTKETCPCRNCEHRTQGCHTQACEHGWPEWDAWWKARKQEIDKQLRLESALSQIGKKKRRQKTVARYLHQQNHHEEPGGAR